MAYKSKSKNNCNVLHFLLISGIFMSIFVGVSSLPQWVWNKDAIDNSKNNNNYNNGQNQQLVLGQPSRFPESAAPDTRKSNIRVVEGEARLIPRTIGAISNSIQSITGGGGSGSSGGGALGGLFGSVLQNIPQLATQAISGIFNRPPSITLPAKDPGNIFPGGGSNNGGGSGGSSSSGACKCVQANECFLPYRPNGSCEGGKVKCCSASRTLFPDEENSSGSDSSRSERTVTQREIRQGLLKNILKGSRSFVDDALDLILTPYLNQEDQRKIATRVVAEE